MNLSSRSYNSEIDLPAVLALPSQAKKRTEILSAAKDDKVRWSLL